MKASDMEVASFDSDEVRGVNAIVAGAHKAAVHAAFKMTRAHPVSCMAVFLAQAVSMLEHASPEGMKLLLEDLTAEKQDADRQMRAMKLLIAGYEAQTAEGTA